jgi:hypothetical protein
MVRNHRTDSTKYCRMDLREVGIFEKNLFNSRPENIFTITEVYSIGKRISQNTKMF